MLTRFFDWLRRRPSSVDIPQDYNDRITRAAGLLRRGREGIKQWNALKRAGQLSPPRVATPPAEIVAALERALANSVDVGDGVRMANLGDYIEEPAGGWTQALRVVNDIEADESGPNLPSFDLSELDLTDVDLSFCNLCASNFSGSVLDGANFTKSNLTLARFSGARAHYASFHSAYLSSADLTNADLYHASFSRANLVDALIVDADLTEADLSMARLLRADLRDTIVERAVVMDLHVQELVNPPRPPAVLFLAPGRAPLRREDIRHVFHTGWKTRFPARSVFISYRRADTADIALRLFDELSSSIGADRIFLDRRTIPVGAENFEVDIDMAIRHTTLVLLLVGERWNSARTAEPTDHVRREIERALSVDATILPVLIGSASMPDREELPPSIEAVSLVQAAGPFDVQAHPESISTIVEAVRGMMEE